MLAKKFGLSYVIYAKVLTVFGMPVFFINLGQLESLVNY